MEQEIAALQEKHPLAMRSLREVLDEWDARMPKYHVPDQRASFTQTGSSHGLLSADPHEEGIIGSNRCLSATGGVL